VEFAALLYKVVGLPDVKTPLKLYVYGTIIITMSNMIVGVTVAVVMG